MSVPNATCWWSILAAGVLLAGCRSSRASQETSVVFTRLPKAGEGSSVTVNAIEGRVSGARPGQRVVVFAHSGVWWIQPLADNFLTEIHADSTWKTVTHPGSGYAALVVDASWRPPPTLDVLPKTGGPVAAIVVAEGSKLASPRLPTLEFSGYEWRLRQTPGNTGGSTDFYDPANAWTDRDGFLHLRIAGKPDKWTGAEATLTRSLGYGSYRFVVRDVSHLDPADVLAFSTWDDSGPTREMDIEISRWGEPTSRNAQFVIQPYHVPANTVRFMAAKGTSTFNLQWEPGRASFKNWRGSHDDPVPVAAHVFTSGVPLPGDEMMRINFYVFQNKKYPLQHGTEVIIEKFEFLP
jgi:hypothetical protein